MSKDITHIDREINKKRINTFDKKKYYYKEYHTTTGYQRKRKFFNALFISPAASLKLSKKNTGFQYTAIFLPTSIASLKPNAMEVRPIYLYIFSLFSYLFSKHPCVYRVIRWLPTIICLWPSNKKHF